jgi:hypothetical protein
MLRDSLIRLWMDHVVWTRNFIISSLANLADISAVTQRLLKNQEDIGQVFGQIAGPPAGQALTALLKEHIQIAANIVGAAKVGDSAKVASESKKWDDNAMRLAAAISQVIPSLPLATTQKMMRDHLAVTTAELQARVRGDWPADVRAFDQVLSQAMHMADAMATGIRFR